MFFLFFFLAVSSQVTFLQLPSKLPHCFYFSRKTASNKKSQAEGNLTDGKLFTNPMIKQVLRVDPKEEASVLELGFYFRHSSSDTSSFENVGYHSQSCFFVQDQGTFFFCSTSI